MDGGQITIKPSTRWTGNTTVTDSVAYGWGCWDSPSEFNTHMERQAALIADGRVNAGGADLFLGTVFAGLQWVANATTAPGGNWLNYVFPGRKKSTSGGHDYYDYSSEETNIKQHEYPANPNPRNIYVPGLSTFMAYGPGASSLRNQLQNPDTDNYAGVYHPNMEAYSAGADCSGFVCAAAGYPGNSYVMSRVNTSGLASDANSYLIADGTANSQIQPDNLDKVVPGDILVRPDYHVVMVLSVTPNADGTVTRDGIRFIHMGAGENEEYQVLTNNTWAADQGLGGQWFRYQVRRLR